MSLFKKKSFLWTWTEHFLQEIFGLRTMWKWMNFKSWLYRRPYISESDGKVYGIFMGRKYASYFATKKRKMKWEMHLLECDNCNNR